MSEAEKKPRFNQDQYDMLIRCSDKKDITEWNEWRNAHPIEEIFLEGAHFINAHLEGVFFINAHLEGAFFSIVHLEGANFSGAHLENAYFIAAHLEDAIFNKSYTNKGTSFLNCSINRNTDFREVSLEIIRIEQGKKQLLEYNNRRMNWQDWYRSESDNKLIIKLHQFVTLPVHWFWGMSNDSRQIVRFIITCFALAIIFALIYRLSTS